MLFEAAEIGLSWVMDKFVQLEKPELDRQSETSLQREKWTDEQRSDYWEGTFIKRAKFEFRNKEGRLIKSREEERARALTMMISGHTPKEIAKVLGRSPSRIYEWRKVACEKGVPVLLSLHQGRGRPPQVTKEAFAELREGWRLGRWIRAKDAATWLRDQHGINLSASGMRYWLKKAEDYYNEAIFMPTEQSAACQCETNPYANLLFEPLTSEGAWLLLLLRNEIAMATRPSPMPAKKMKPSLKMNAAVKKMFRPRNMGNAFKKSKI